MYEKKQIIHQQTNWQSVNLQSHQLTD